MKRFTTFIILLMSWTAEAEVATLSAQLQVCAKIESHMERLGCYDQLSQSTQPIEQAQLEIEASPSVTENNTPTAQQEDNFGKMKRSDDIDSINSSIVGEFKGWIKGDILTLANGQKWKVTGDTRGYVKLLNPKIKIEKGFWGSFNMKVEGLNAQSKVKRVE